MSSLQKEIIKSKAKTLPDPSGLFRLHHNRVPSQKRDYEPVSWTKYFSERTPVTVDDDTFYVYSQGNEGPLLVLLHGGGYSALTWAQFTKCITSLVASCQILAIDLRGHGSSTTKDDDDLSIGTLAKDVARVLESISNNRPVIVVGHSLGGAVAVHAAPLLTNVVGVVVIDVVEGTAIDALRSMQGFLRSRPSRFASIVKAVEWCVRSGQIRNLQSAKVSVPGQIKNVENNKLAADDLESEPKSEEVDTSEVSTTSVSAPMGTIIEGELSSTSTPQESTIKSDKYTWRINLAKTEKYWNEWFHGLSSAFLELSAPKMLLLAGVDRLDRELTVGQMQGKFQLQVLTACGHAVQEDAPDKVAEAVATFLVRHKFAEPTEDFTWTVPAC